MNIKGKVNALVILQYFIVFLYEKRQFFESWYEKWCTVLQCEEAVVQGEIQKKMFSTLSCVGVEDIRATDSWIAMCKDQWEEVPKTRLKVGFYVYRLVKQSASCVTLHVSETTDIKGTIYMKCN